MSFESVLKEGKLYYPASDHYPDITKPCILCDRCNKVNLNISVGHNAIDLCLTCTHEVAELLKQNIQPTIIKNDFSNFLNSYPKPADNQTLNTVKEDSVEKQFTAFLNKPIVKHDRHPGGKPKKHYMKGIMPLGGPFGGMGSN